MYKKIVSAIISLAMIVAVISLPVLATEETIVSIRVPTGTGEAPQSTYSLYHPSKEHKFSTEGNYSGEFEDVVYEIFSDFWFKCSSNNDLYMKINTNRRCTVTLYDRKDAGIKVTYPVAANDTDYIHFYNLDPSHEYYFGFTNKADFASNNTMRGNYTVYQTNPLDE